MKVKERLGNCSRLKGRGKQSCPGAKFEEALALSCECKAGPERRRGDMTAKCSMSFRFRPWTSVGKLAKFE